MQHYITLTNSELDVLISEKIHSQRDREIMRMKLIDGFTAEKTAEIMQMSSVQIYRIIKRCKKLIEN